MDSDEYIGVTEFSRVSGVSRQTVYNRMKNDLAKYVKIIDGVNMIHIDGLELFGQATVQNNSQYEAKDLLSFLQDQIDVKDRQLLAATEQLEVKDVQLERLNQRLKEALALNHNNQVLLLEKKEVEPEETPVAEVDRSWWKFWK